MRYDIQLPRLTRVDVENLRRVCGQLDAGAAVLVQSGWSGKFPVLTMLEQAKQIVAELYNRSEPAYLHQLSRLPRTLKQALAEEVAKDQKPPDAPPAPQGQEEV